MGAGAWLPSGTVLTESVAPPGFAWGSPGRIAMSLVIVKALWAGLPSGLRVELEGQGIAWSSPLALINMFADMDDVSVFAEQVKDRFT